MTERAEREEFPTVGPEVGRTLALCTRLRGASTVLELGSGFGYSAYWIARVLRANGSVTLVERDESLLSDAQRYFERGSIADRAVFECEDALPYADAADGTYDLIVLDHDTVDYIHGFELARDLVAPGGAILTDNVAVYESELDPGELSDVLDGAEPPNERTRVVAAFLRRLQKDDIFETMLLPVGEGLAVSARTD